MYKFVKGHITFFAFILVANPNIPVAGIICMMTLTNDLTYICMSLFCFLSAHKGCDFNALSSVPDHMYICLCVDYMCF